MLTCVDKTRIARAWRLAATMTLAVLTASPALVSLATVALPAHAQDGNGGAKAAHRTTHRTTSKIASKFRSKSAQADKKKRIRTPKLRVGKLRWKRTEEGAYSLGVAYQVEAALLFRLDDTQAARGLLRHANEHYTRAEVPGDCSRDPACSPYLVRQMLQLTDSVTRRIESTRLIQNIGSLQLVAGVRFSKDGEAAPLPVTDDLVLHLNPTLERGGYVLSARFLL